MYIPPRYRHENTIRIGPGPWPKRDYYYALPPSPPPPPPPRPTPPPPPPITRASLLNDILLIRDPVARADFLAAWWATDESKTMAPPAFSPLLADTMLHGLEVAYNQGRRDGLALPGGASSARPALAEAAVPQKATPAQLNAASMELAQRAAEVARSAERLKSVQRDHEAATIKLRKQRAELRRLQAQEQGARRLNFDGV